MYEAYRDTYYLDRLVHNTDLVLANRDSVRGVADYAGRSRPAWRAANPYTVGIARLTDDTGAPVLEVRSALAYADQATATVRSGEGGRFTLAVTNTKYARTDTFADVTMDPAGPDYVVRRVYDAYPTGTMVTVRDLRSAPAAGASPAAGDTGLTSAPAVFAVHTGMISYPIAGFAATVLADPRLRRNAHYRQKAEEYLAAARDAVAVHDEEWRDGPGGTGWFQWPKGMPVPYDGNVQPINQSVALGRTYLALAAATRDKTYLDRATRLARMLAGQVEVSSGGTATWHYWPTTGQMYDGYAKTGDPATDLSIYTPAYGSSGRGNQQYEDVSHGAIEVDFAVRAFRSGVVFRGEDLAAFAATFTRNVATTTPEGIATTHTRVDGSGGLAVSGQYLQAPRWMAVAWWDSGCSPTPGRSTTTARSSPGSVPGCCASPTSTGTPAAADSRRRARVRFVSHPVRSVVLPAGPSSPGALDRLVDRGEVSLFPPTFGLDALDAPPFAGAAQVVGVDGAQQVELAVRGAPDQVLGVHRRHAGGQIGISGVERDDVVGAQVLSQREPVERLRNLRDQLRAAGRAGRTAVAVLRQHRIGEAVGERRPVSAVDVQAVVDHGLADGGSVLEQLDPGGEIVHGRHSQGLRRS